MLPELIGPRLTSPPLNPDQQAYTAQGSEQIATASLASKSEMKTPDRQAYTARGGALMSERFRTVNPLRMAV